MKKLLNVLGIFGSIILTFVLTILIFVYVFVLNIKLMVSENGISNALKSIDVVETLKSIEDETIWEDFVQLADSLNLSEEQFEEILNSNKVKEEVGVYLGEVLSSTLNDKKANLTKDKIEDFLNIAVDEYNKVSDTKISDSERKEIVASFDEEMIENMNEELGSIDLTETVDSNYIEYIKITDNLLFGNYSMMILTLILLIIGLIALFRFSYYKWMPYVKTSALISGSLMLIIGILLLIVPIPDLEIIMPLRKVLATRIFVTTAILFAIVIALTISEKCLKKICNKKKESKKTEVIEQPETKELEKKNDETLEEKPEKADKAKKKEKENNNEDDNNKNKKE